MLVPLGVFAVAIVAFGLFSSPLVKFFEDVAGGYCPGQIPFTDKAG